MGNHYLFEHRHIFVLVPIQNLYFQRYMVYSFLCSVIVSFIDIGGIVDNHCLNFLFWQSVLLYLQEDKWEHNGFTIAKDVFLSFWMLIGSEVFVFRSTTRRILYIHVIGHSRVLCITLRLLYLAWPTIFLFLAVVSYTVKLFVLCIWVSEWLLFNANSAMFQLLVYHGENKLICNEMMMRSALF